jgi:predicted kinase
VSEECRSDRADVTVLVGVSGSGKSTYARSHFKAIQILSTDQMRSQIADSPDALEADATSVQILLEILEERCRGLDSVIDSTGLSADFRRSIRAVAERQLCDVRIVHIDVSIDICLARNRFRDPDRRVPDAVIREQFAAIQSAMGEVRDEGYRSVLTETGDSRMDEGGPGMRPTTLFLSIPVSENFNSSGTFRPERRAFYEGIFSVLRGLDIDIECAALNEDWGAIKLKTVEFTSYDLDAIDRSDGLMVVSNTRLSSDIYLEIGYAAAHLKPILLVVPWGTRITYMLEGMAELGTLTVIRFDAEVEAVDLLLSGAGRDWLTEIGRSRK